HRQHPLHLAAEIGVARRVDDVDPELLAGGRAPADGGVLGEDGDAAFLLQVVAVHHPLGQLGAFAQGVRLLEQLVDQGRLAVVDVGDDGDVAEILDGHAKERRAGRPTLSWRKRGRYYTGMRALSRLNGRGCGILGGSAGAAPAPAPVPAPTPAPPPEPVLSLPPLPTPSRRPTPP